MHNPYNWDINQKYGLNKDDLVKKESESESEYHTRLLNELSIACVIKNVIKTGINLAKMNLIDSISILTSLDNNFDTCEHDINVLKRELQDYKYICDYIQEIEKVFRK